MNIMCPNCQSCFAVDAEHLPAPKFNTAHNRFGWKFECGHCDTQWWNVLEHSAPNTYHNPVTHTAPTPYHQRMDQPSVASSPFNNGRRYVPRHANAMHVNEAGQRLAHSYTPSAEPAPVAAPPSPPSVKPKPHMPLRLTLDGRIHPLKRPRNKALRYGGGLVVMLSAVGLTYYLFPHFLPSLSVPMWPDLWSNVWSKLSGYFSR